MAMYDTLNELLINNAYRNYRQVFVVWVFI
jgi:hypothetical protein